MPKVAKGHRVLSIFQNLFKKVNQVIYSSIPIYSPGFKALASIAFDISSWQDFIHIFSKGHNSGKGHNLDGKNICVSYFFMKNPYMNFQNPRMHTRTNVPEAICPSYFFKVGGINTDDRVMYGSCILQFPSWPSIDVSSFIKLSTILLEICSVQKWQTDGRMNN